MHNSVQFGVNRIRDLLLPLTIGARDLMERQLMAVWGGHLGCPMFKL